MAQNHNQNDENQHQGQGQDKPSYEQLESQLAQANQTIAWYKSYFRDVHFRVNIVIVALVFLILAAFYAYFF
jgi:hypothetical protein